MKTLKCGLSPPAIKPTLDERHFHKRFERIQQTGNTIAKYFHHYPLEHIQVKLKD
ncbi:hypothetical protein [Chelonobacter oris]|uniref:hypothetical protein n=1 Tax=Chelonobacter oris TaxID=505317 RepID=UPI00244AAF73|nr:hypothetical protein [Chelonobacter oris]